MKIGVISDTHLREPDPLLQSINEKYFKDADMILHAGDITSPSVLNAFDKKKMIVVSGNNDPSEIRKRFPVREIVTAGNFKIGLVHGEGFPFWLQRRVSKAFDHIDCIVYGHSHWAVNHRRNGILFFNPGSYSGGPTSLWRRSIGVLTIDKDIRGEIISI